MKRSLCLLLALVTVLFLAACSGRQAKSPPPQAVLGTYLCTAMQMDQVPMTPGKKWLKLSDQWKMSLFLSEEPDEGTWRLDGTAITLTMGGETVGTGTLKDDTITLDMMGMTYTFMKDGSEALARQQVTQQEKAGTSVFSCYGDLYTVRYPSDRFYQDPAGLSDLYSDDGVKGWVTKLDSQERVDKWLAGFDEKASHPDYQNYETGDLTVAGYPARSIVYQDDDGWHSEVLVQFGSDLGTETYPMFAAYLYFTGGSQEAVWNPTIQGIVTSLQLTSPEP